ncbi:predicted protein [Naegleria gruberi]|uniref:Predicted protein n=1 Tax=Naegleria gruberi TaxID=5762 RepID=D2V7B4_NAEGR|nr:uncharacterized protein NAEGRDRAFT_64736 [Naegleria gruberi]EFC47347.1 predicted protein [Naegleria gruberi]|eukprot:XP_002680091.1 predicted protein [Naegleria gruberi strain NEG-M]
MLGTTTPKTPISPLSGMPTQGSSDDSLKQLQQSLGTSLNPNSSDSMLFYASQSLERGTKVLDFADFFKFQLREYEKSLQTVNKSLLPLDEKISTLDVKDHKDLQTFLAILHQGFIYTNNQNVILQERIDRLQSNDIESFSKTWKLIRDFNTEYVKTQKKNIKKRRKVPTSVDDQIRELRENRGLKKKLYEGLGDLRTVFEEFVHSQLFYHSKCMEMWAAVWEETQKNKKEEQARRRQEEEDDEEKLNELLKASSVLHQN